MSVSAISAKSMYRTDGKNKTTLAVQHALRLLIEKVEPYHTYLSTAGSIMQQLQLIGFVFSPAYQYVFPVVDQLTYVVFVFSLPLFDKHYFDVSYTAYMAVTAVFMALLIAIAGLFIIGVMRPRVLEYKLFLKIARHCLESVGGWLYIPLTHLFLGGMMCSGDNVANFPGVACTDGMRTANIVIGSIGLLFTYIIGLLMCWVFDPDLDSEHPLARPHGYYDIMCVTTKLVLSIFYHILFTTGKAFGFCIVALIGFLFLLGALIVIIPYFKSSAAQLRSGTLTVALYIAIINLLDAKDVAGLTTSMEEVKTFVAISLVPVVALFGATLSEYRVSSAMKNRLRMLHVYGVVPEHVAVLPFPRTFVFSDSRVIPPTLRAIESDLQQEMTLEDAGGSDLTADSEKCGGPSAMQQRELLVPYLERVRLPIDAETATRFLRLYKLETGTTIRHSATQLTYALRIYTKALVYFKQSSYVTVSIAWFLYRYCNRVGAVVELLNDLESHQQQTMDFMVMFKCYRLLTTAKESLGYRDSTHLFALQRARMHHRHAISTTIKFWNMLLEESDRISLIVASNQLSLQRRIAMEEYRLALSTSQDDRTTLHSISAFVEDLLSEKEVAQELRNAIDDIEQQKKNRMMRGAHSKGAISQIRFDDIIAATKMEDTAHGLSQGSERRIFIALLYVTLVLVFAGSCTMMALTIVDMNLSTKNTLAIMEARQGKAYGHLAVYHAQKSGIYSYENDCIANVATTPCTSDSNFMDMIQNIAIAEMHMRMKQNLVTYGKYGPAFNTKSYLYLSTGEIPLRFFVEGREQYLGTFSAKEGPAVSMYGVFTNILSSVSIPRTEWIAAPIVSGYMTSLANSMRRSNKYFHYLQFLTDGGVDVFFDSMNSLTTVLAVDVRDFKGNKSVGFIVALVVLLVAVLVGVAAFYVNVEWIAKNRVLLMGIFSGIPRLFLEQLKEDAANRLNAFDLNTDSRDNDDALQLAAHDEDGMEEDIENDPKAAAGAGGGHHGKHRDLSFLQAILNGTPHKSCFKNADGHYMDMEGKPTKNVKFRLPQSDLPERPRARLFEPKVSMSGNGKELVEDFEKSLVEIDDEMKRENQLMQQRRDNTTERMVSTSYRVQWCAIKEQIAAWNANVALFDKLFAGVLVPLLAIIVAVVLVLTSVGFSNNKDALNIELTGFKQITEVYNNIADFDRFDIASSVFINFFSLKSSQEVVNYAFVTQRYAALIRRLERQFDPTILRSVPEVSNLYLALVAPVLTDTIYCSLAARAGYGMNEFELLKSPYLAMFYYGPEENDVYSLSEQYPRVFYSPQDYTIPQMADLPDDVTDFHNEVLAMHRRERFFDNAKKIRSTLSIATAGIEQNTIADVEKVTSVTGKYMIVVMALSSVFIVGGVAATVLVFKYKQHKILRYLFIVAILCQISVLILAAITYVSVRQRGDEIATGQKAIEAVSVYRTSVFLRLALCERFIHSQEEIIFLTIQEYAPAKLKDGLKDIYGYKESQRYLQQVFATDAETWSIQEVALFLAYGAHVLEDDPTADPYPPSPPFIAEYNYAKEPNYAIDVDRFGSDHPALQYTTPAVDFAGTYSEVRNKARFALFGERGYYYFTKSFDALDALSSSLFKEMTATMEKHDANNNYLLIIMMAVGGLSTLLVCSAAVLPLVLFVLMMGDGKNKDLVHATIKVSYSKQLVLLYVMAAIIAMLGATQFILAVLPMNNGDDATRAALQSSSRIGSLYNSLTKAVAGNHAVQSSTPTLAITSYQSLAEEAKKMLDARNYLYFRDKASSKRYAFVTTLTPEQRQTVLEAGDNGVSLDSLYMAWTDAITKLSDFRPEVVVSVSDPNANFKDTYELSPDLKTFNQNAVDQLESMYADIAKGLTASDELYKTSFESSLKSTLAPAIVFFTVIAILVLVTGGYVIPKFMSQFKKEEEEMRILLKAIPEVVQDAVPSIALFMGSGVIEEDAEVIVESQGTSPPTDRFLTEWSQAEPDEGGMERCEQLERCKDSGVLLCDARGTILFCNVTFLTYVRYGSLRGKNIEILMEPSVAEVHAGFMKYYMQNPRPGGPRSLDVVMYTKDGETLRMVVVLREAPTKSGQMYFLAEVHRYPKADAAKSIPSSTSRAKESGNPLIDPNSPEAKK